MLLVLAFGYAMTWVYAVLGLSIGDPETAMAAGFPVLAPLVFASSAFVPVATMPGWLQAFANNQPVTQTASAIRACVLGGPIASYAWHSLAWSIAIVRVRAARRLALPYCRLIFACQRLITAAVLAILTGTSQSPARNTRCRNPPTTGRSARTQSATAPR